MKINHREGQPSVPRLQGTFPQKMASVPASDSFQFTDGDYVMHVCNEI